MKKEVIYVIKQTQEFRDFRLDARQMKSYKTLNA
jgi:hypothetical protein